MLYREVSRHGGGQILTMFAVLIVPIPLGLTEQTSKIDLRYSRQVLLYERFTGSDAEIERRRFRRYRVL